jgi:phosphomannomutase
MEIARESVSQPLIVTVSGLRGVVGQSLTPEVAARYAATFGSLLPRGRVVVGRDSRPSGAMLGQAVRAGLASVGCDAIDLGIAATPTVGVAVRQTDALGGVMISASHNPPQWNGIKLMHATGRLLDAEQAQAVRQRFESGAGIPRATWDLVGRIGSEPDPHAAHLERVLRVVDVPRIRARRFRVVLDSNHGAGGVLGARLLDALGCDVEMLGGTPDGHFEHNPEPLPEHLGALCQRVRGQRADLGFAQDPDADRLALVAETGVAIGEELTLALAAQHWLAEHPGPVVINLSTSRATEDVAARRGVPLHRAAVGEANVVTRMLATASVLGGEGNGGVILPDVVLIRDSFSAMALVLDLLAATAKTISQLAAGLPQYHMIKHKVALSQADLTAAFHVLRNHFGDAAVHGEDGLRLAWPDRWVHVRPSNTEPIARIIVEARTEDSARELLEAVGRLLMA